MNTEKWNKKNGNRKKKVYGLKKTKYMTMINGREKQEQIKEEVKEGKIDGAGRYIQLLRNNAKQRR